MALSKQYSLKRLDFELLTDAEINCKSAGARISGVRAVFWSHGDLWLEATAYLANKAFEQESLGKSLDTINGHASSLTVYGTFLEQFGLDWFRFPKDRSKRPTYLFRGHLIQEINNCNIARTTAARHITVIRAFYHWVRECALIDRASEPYRTNQTSIRFTDDFGLTRVKQIQTSDLAIRAPRSHIRGVENGLYPIKLQERNQLLRVAEKNFSPEFVLALKLGFFTGMRIQSILGLTQTVLRKHLPSRELEGWFSIEIGGHSGVPAKQGAHYFPSIPSWLLNELLDYCKRPRHAIRQKKAKQVNQDLVFIGQRGQRLNSRSYSQHMTKLRALLQAQGLMLNNFHFHCTRATFGTALVLMLLDAAFPTKNILQKLMATMGHASAESSLSYIKFIENEKEMADMAAAYSSYLGLSNENNE